MDRALNACWAFGRGPSPSVHIVIDTMFHSRTILWLMVLVVAVVQTQPAAAYVPDERWTVTASGATGVTGTPITLTWSFVRDGASIPGEGGSDLIAYLDRIFNVSATGGDFTQRPWFSLFEQSFDRWSDLSGITFLYEPNDNGSVLQSSSGVRGVRGDVRLGGAFVDGQNGTLAYTWLPNSGDLVVDTGETNFYSNPTNNYRALRNTIMHEVAHALGLLHIQSSSDALLMEPTIALGIDGPQLDDIRGIHGFYGDALEKANNGLGNGTYQRATSMGMLTTGNTLAIGADAIGGQAVSPTETDFVSIANSSDFDFFSFTVAEPTLLDVTLTPLGGNFNQGTEGGAQSVFDANSRNDLNLAVFGPNGSTLLGSANFTGSGGIEMISDLELTSAGMYFVRVGGSSANVQMYELELSAALLAMALPGDYNADGIVNAADYVVWRNSLGQTGASLAADGSGDQIVNLADYGIWKTNFGRSSSTGSALFVAVPEPHVHTLLTIGTLVALIQFAIVSRRRVSPYRPRDREASQRRDRLAALDAALTAKYSSKVSRNIDFVSSLSQPLRRKLCTRAGANTGQTPHGSADSWYRSASERRADPFELPA
jgi:hypothetical protein